MKQNRNGVIDIPRKYLEERARALAGQNKWLLFIDILARLIFGVVLFPNVDGLVDLAEINAFLAFHHNIITPEHLTPIALEFVKFREVSDRNEQKSTKGGVFSKTRCANSNF